MKLEIGCGEKQTKGYTHLDIRELPGIDIIDDAETLVKIKDGSCDEIMTTQVLEHFSHTKTLNILKVWYKKLKPNGILHIEVPDLKLFCTLWVNGYIKEPWAFKSIYGLQDYKKNTHKAGFSKGYLIYLLLGAGFITITDLMADITNPDCIIKLIAYKRRRKENGNTSIN